MSVISRRELLQIAGEHAGKFLDAACNTLRYRDQADLRSCHYVRKDEPLSRHSGSGADRWSPR